MKQKNDSAKRATLGKLSGLVGIVCNVCLAGSKLAGRKTCRFHVDYGGRIKSTCPMRQVRS